MPFINKTSLSTAFLLLAAFSAQPFHAEAALRLSFVAPVTCADSPANWHDSDGPEFNCQYYAQDNNCQNFGDQYANFGKNANQACCACGGGETSPDTVPPRTASPPVSTTNNGVLTMQQKITILDQHNKYRSDTALGKTPNQPKAKDMHKLVWDEELATKAAKWASTCPTNHVTYPAIENIAWGYGLNTAGWYDEHKWYTFPGQCAPPTANDSCGHYENMVSSGVVSVGCGFRTCDNGYGDVLVCQYGGESKPYQATHNDNEVASVCMPGYTANKATGLCERTA